MRFLAPFLVLLGVAPTIGADPFVDLDRKLAPLSDPVVDQAGLISDNDQSELNQLLRDLRSSDGPQIVILTLSDLSGLEIEQASIHIVEKWQLGSKSKDDGILILIAQSERAMRIEVGQGLEGDVPDAYSKRIVDQLLIPAFRQGEFSSGIKAAVYRIIELTAPNFAAKRGLETQTIERRPHAVKISWMHIVLFLALGWFLLFTSLGRGMLIMMLLSSRNSRSSYGGGFGGGGSGGFGGGGGGFSGGGASGRW